MTTYTDKQKRAALQAAKKVTEAHQALAAYLDTIPSGQRLHPYHRVVLLMRDLHEEAALIERRCDS